MICKSCNSDIRNGSVFCTNCGTRIETEPAIAVPQPQMPEIPLPPAMPVTQSPVPDTPADRDIPVSATIPVTSDIPVTPNEPVPNAYAPPQHNFLPPPSVPGGPQKSKTGLIVGIVIGGIVLFTLGIFIGIVIAVIATVA